MHCIFVSHIAHCTRASFELQDSNRHCSTSNMYPPLKFPYHLCAVLRFQKTASSLSFSPSCNHILWGENHKTIKKRVIHKLSWAMFFIWHGKYMPFSFKNQSQTRHIPRWFKPGGIKSEAISPRLIMLTPISSPGIVSGTWWMTYAKYISALEASHLATIELYGR